MTDAPKTTRIRRRAAAEAMAHRTDLYDALYALLCHHGGDVKIERERIDKIPSDALIAVSPFEGGLRVQVGKAPV